MSFKRNCSTSKSCLFPIPRLTYREWIGQLLRMYKAAAKQLVAIFTEPAVMVWLSTELTSPASDVCLPSVVMFMDTILFFQLLAAEIMDNFLFEKALYTWHISVTVKALLISGGGVTQQSCVQGGYPVHIPTLNRLHPFAQPLDCITSENTWMN